MELGKLKFTDWYRYAGCIEIYAADNNPDPDKYNYTFAITAYHDKVETEWNPPPQDYYNSDELANWQVLFYNVSPKCISSAENIQNVYNLLYGKFVPATEKDIKNHVNNFIKRLNKIKIFV